MHTPSTPIIHQLACYRSNHSHSGPLSCSQPASLCASMESTTTTKSVPSLQVKFCFLSVPQSIKVREEL